jgi:peptidylprolyl isomerase
LQLCFIISFRHDLVIVLYSLKFHKVHLASLSLPECWVRRIVQLKGHCLHIGLILFGVWLAGEARCADVDAVIAKMGGVELRASEVRKLIEAQNPEIKLQIESGPETLEKLVRVELLRRAILQEALHKAWDKRPEVMNQIGIDQEKVVVSSYVNQLARAPADYPSEVEVEAAYNENKDALKAPPQYHIYQIYIADALRNDRQLQEAARMKASEIGAKAREKDSDFVELAKKYSEHKPSALQGGEMGWLSEDQLLPDVRYFVATMKPGDVSEAIHTSHGWHIIFMQERREAALRQLDDVRAYLVQTLRWRKAQENESKYLVDLVSRSPISVNQAGLNQFVGRH